MALLLGYDIGSSFIKACVLDAQTGAVRASAISPDTELEIIAGRPGWAEQDPQTWWQNLKKATAKLKAHVNLNPADVKAIGISYQMHGLVLIDKNAAVLRPAIIWCDSRAVSAGDHAAKLLGRKKCLENLLNLPGNFTAARLMWVKQNEPDIYRKIDKILLPGDYIAMKITGRAVTTPSGLSEAILWDFRKNALAGFVLDALDIPEDLIPPAVPAFSVQGQLAPQAAKELGLAEGTLVSYRAGDQPNNALALNVLDPGQVAATAGTSGVIYAVTDKANYDPQNRVNTFVHVNHSSDSSRYGILFCLNGAGICNSWLKHNFGSGRGDYDRMNAQAEKIAPGADGLSVFPYGNGAERSLENKNIGAFIAGLNFNIHDKRHFFRAAQEGIVFALNFGLQIMRNMGNEIRTVRAGRANMFLSPVFSKIFAAVTGCTVQLYDTDGSAGAARGAGFGAGIYKTLEEAFAPLQPLCTIEPDNKIKDTYSRLYSRWQKLLFNRLNEETL